MQKIDKLSGQAFVRLLVDRRGALNQMRNELRSWYEKSRNWDI